MTVSLFTFIDLYGRALGNADHLLNKGMTFAKEQGGTGEECLGWRLAEDMHPLGFQLMVLCNFTRQWPARVAGLPLPEANTSDLDVAGFKAAIADARAYLAGLSAEQFAGRDDVPLNYVIVEGMAPTLPSGHWLTVFATTNVYFHLTTTYSILRMKGVPLGKADMFATGL